MQDENKKRGGAVTFLGSNLPLFTLSLSPSHWNPTYMMLVIRLTGLPLFTAFVEYVSNFFLVAFSYTSCSLLTDVGTPPSSIDQLIPWLTWKGIMFMCELVHSFFSYPPFYFPTHPFGSKEPEGGCQVATIEPKNPFFLPFGFAGEKVKWVQCWIQRRISFF